MKRFFGGHAHIDDPAAAAMRPYSQFFYGMIYTIRQTSDYIIILKTQNKNLLSWHPRLLETCFNLT